MTTMELGEMHIGEILNYLPHRYPFLLIDRVTSLVPGKSINGYKNVTMNEDMFNGHFPNQPIMPGVLIIEAAAQLSGILAFETQGTRPLDGKNYLFGGLEKARFKRPVVPGDRLDLRSVIIAKRSKMMKFEIEAHVSEKTACSAKITVFEQTL